MDIINLITGLIIIGMGFLVKSFPNLIAGYNTMPKDKKKNIDIEGLSTFMRNSLIIIGLSIIIGHYLFKWIGFTAIANSMILIVILIGVTIMVINAQRFDHNKNKTKKTRLTYYILGFVIAFVIGFITYGYVPSKVVISKDLIKLTGMYGFEMSTSEINNVELMDRIPTIKMRTNGFSLGNIHKGTFILDEFGKCRLLLHSSNPPYLIMSRTDGNKIIINFRNIAETQKIFKNIKKIFDKK